MKFGYLAVILIMPHSLLSLNTDPKPWYITAITSAIAHDQGPDEQFYNAHDSLQTELSDISWQMRTFPDDLEQIKNLQERQAKLVGLQKQVEQFLQENLDQNDNLYLDEWLEEEHIHNTSSATAKLNTGTELVSSVITGAKAPNKAFFDTIAYLKRRLNRRNQQLNSIEKDIEIFTQAGYKEHVSLMQQELSLAQQEKNMLASLRKDIRYFLATNPNSLL